MSMRGRHLSLLIAGLLAGGLVASEAQAKKRPRKKAAAAAKVEAAAPVAVEPAPSEKIDGDKEPAAPTAAAPAKPRVYTFSGLDVNGTLKAPQLLFFRGRVQQELDTSSPERRSFLKELERTADAPGL